MTRRIFTTLLASLGLVSATAAQTKESTIKQSFSVSTEPMEWWTYEPKMDMTIGELAVIMPLLLGMRNGGQIEYLKSSLDKYPGIDRHFKHFGGTK